MTSERDSARLLLKLLDLGITSVAFFCAFYIRENFPSQFLKGLVLSIDYHTVFLLVIIVWYLVSGIFDLHKHYGRNITKQIFYDLFRALLITIILLITCLFIFKIEKFRRLLMGIFFLLDLLLLLLSRWIAFQIISSRKKDPYHIRNLLIIGSKKTAKEVVNLISHNAGWKIVGCLETDKKYIGREVGPNVKVIGTLGDMGKIFMEQAIDEVIIAMPLNSIKNSEHYLSLIRAFGITTRIIPSWYIRKFLSAKPYRYVMEIEQFFAEPAFILTSNIMKRDALVIKNIIDITGAFILLVVTSPLFLIIPIAIRAFSKGPVLYRQVRCGLYGKEFTLYKFRTMKQGAEKMLPHILASNEADGPVFKMKNDPRVIPYVGKFLRKTGMDELPQLFNVLMGQMSLVGPRPPLPAEVKQYEIWQRKRLSMKPGLTCIWQIQSRRNDIPFKKWMEMDLDYINDWSLWLDLKLLVMTIPVVFSAHGR